MPEGPECRRIAISLAEAWSGKTLEQVSIESGRYLKKDPSGLDLIQHNLPTKIVGCGSHGKFIYAICANEFFIWFTLGMTGCFSQEETGHSRVRFRFSGLETWFEDQRNFGTIKFVKGRHKMIEKLESLGPDMLAEDVTDVKFRERMRKKQDWSLCKALMDQSIVAGIGNYIKSDSLWLARLAPNRLIKDCSDAELAILNRSIKNVMRESMKHGGATIQTFKNLDGSPGRYGSKFLVYNKKQDIDGNAVIKEQTADGRTSWWCPNIQN